MTRARLLPAALLAYSGVLAILYAPIAPVFAPLVDRPVPVAAIAVGVLHLAVALALVRRWSYARPAAIAVVLFDGATQVVLFGGLALGAGAATWYPVVILVAELSVDAVMLGVLLRTPPAHVLRGPGDAGAR